VVDIRDKGRSQYLELAAGAPIEDVDVVVLTQGHLPCEDDQTRDWSRFARAAALGYTKPGNAADLVDNLTEVRPQEPVIVRGLGLTFFDYSTLLTVGRGGMFEEHRDGTLTYRPSGREPFIYAGSRRGVPHHARGENQKGIAGRHHPLLLTPEKITELTAQAAGFGNVDFRRDVWPLIAKEVEVVYYSQLLHDRISPRGLRQFLADYLAAATATETAVCDRFDVAPADRWDWTAILDPTHGKQFPDPTAFQAWLLDYLDEDVRRARLGNVSEPRKAALDVFRDLRNEVRMIVDYSGVTGRSYRDDIDGWYTPLNAFLSIGPPAQRIAEMAAMMRAGVLTIVGPGMHVFPNDGRYAADSVAVENSTVVAGQLIDARLPEPDIRHTDDQLLRALLRRGEIRGYTMRDPDGRTHQTGGLDVTPGPRLVDAQGRSHPHRFALGVPTERVRWVTAAAARPGMNSVTITDADAIARAALSIAVDSSHPDLEPDERKPCVTMDC